MRAAEQEHCEFADKHPGVLAFLRVHSVVDPSHLFQYPLDLAAVTVLIVVPQIKHSMFSVDDSGLGIKNASMP